MPLPEAPGNLINVNFNKIAIEIRSRARDVINIALAQAYNEAQHLVPVRKVFKGSKRITGTRRARFLNRGEAEAELDVRRALNAQAMVYAKATGKKPKLLSDKLKDVMQIQTLKEPTRRGSVPSNPFLRARGTRYAQPDNDRAITQRAGGSGVYSLKNDPQGKTLNARGRWELRFAHQLGIKSAAFRTKAGRTTLGGRLKGEITVVEAKALTGALLQGSVESPTYYARFVEFGTRHAAAQPYLRPALALVRETYRAQMVAALRASGRPARKHYSPKYGR